ncbi:LytR/AlgR family response regulator transcription factor [Mucilaginibacter litoreus]|uniref:LytR/AlgR family response regulator transcription factor n=1 Tax=Mucilaginibacter litoreus TaxID=1048221 RepID=A0ABW3AT13_9SPHI
MINAIAIDDEPVALDIIAAHAQKIPGLNLQAAFSSATEALTYFDTNTVDLIFLDINIPGLTGLEFAEIVRDRAQIIFTTAYADHALKGFDLAATDYLLKPINFTRFLQAYKQSELRLRQPDSKPAAYVETLLIKDGSIWVQIPLSGILYIEAEDNYVSIVENNKRTLTRITLNELQQKLPQGGFLRIHKSFIVPLSKIEKIERHQVTISSMRIPLSRSYRDELFRRLKVT